MIGVFYIMEKNHQDGYLVYWAPLFTALSQLVASCIHIKGRPAARPKARRVSYTRSSFQ